MVDAFKATKAVQLVHPNPAADISLACNASYSHVGAVLQQRSFQGWPPLSFFSKKVDGLKRNIPLWTESC
jgi:hypothetical protein